MVKLLHKEGITVTSGIHDRPCGTPAAFTPSLLPPGKSAPETYRTVRAEVLGMAHQITPAPEDLTQPLIEGGLVHIGAHIIGESGIPGLPEGSLFVGTAWTDPTTMQIAATKFIQPGLQAAGISAELDTAILGGPDVELIGMLTPRPVPTVNKRDAVVSLHHFAEEVLGGQEPELFLQAVNEELGGQAPDGLAALLAYRLPGQQMDTGSLLVANMWTGQKAHDVFMSERLRPALVRTCRVLGLDAQQTTPQTCTTEPLGFAAIPGLMFPGAV
jgi:hypothetical protein